MQNRRDSAFDSSQIPALRALACKSVAQIVQIQNIRTDYKVLKCLAYYRRSKEKRTAEPLSLVMRLHQAQCGTIL
jgi:hypothetical protein